MFNPVSVFLTFHMSKLSQSALLCLVAQSHAVSLPKHMRSTNERCTEYTHVFCSEKTDSFPLYDNHLMAVYLEQLGWAGTRTIRNINSICHCHCPQILHKHFHPSLWGLPVNRCGLILRGTLGKQLKETWRTQEQETLVLYSRNSGFDEAVR